MLKRFALIIGAALIVTGILGFVPGLSTTNASGQQMLLSIFMTGPFHNGFHLASGVVGLLAATSERYARWYFRVFGVVYAALALLGFTVGIGNVNAADHALHAVVAVVLLVIGFGVKAEGGDTLRAKSAA